MHPTPVSPAGRAQAVLSRRFNRPCIFPPLLPPRLQPPACSRACGPTAPTAGTHMSRLPSERCSSGLLRPHVFALSLAPAKCMHTSVAHHHQTYTITLLGRSPSIPVPDSCTLSCSALCLVALLCPATQRVEQRPGSRAAFHLQPLQVRCSVSLDAPDSTDHANSQTRIQIKNTVYSNSTSLPPHLPANVAVTSSLAATAATARPPRRMPSAASSCPLTGAHQGMLGEGGGVGKASSTVQAHLLTLVSFLPAGWLSWKLPSRMTRS